jgi:hypothetical protein
MKFKHAFQVFLDNFEVTYKMLLYRVIIVLFFICIDTAIIYPFITRITDAEQFANLVQIVKQIGENFAKLDISTIETLLPNLVSSVNEFLSYLVSRSSDLIWTAILLFVIYFIQKFLLGLSHYNVAALINDKMALRANSSFIGTMIKNLGKASLYNIIYVPISILYDIVCIITVYSLFFKGLTFIPLLLKVFLFVTVIVALITIKMTFTCDWLPSLISGKTTNRKAIGYSFSRKNKNTAHIFSNFLIIILLILACNVASFFFTFGAGFLITVPASYIFIISFEFVSYYDDNNLRYFTDKNTIIKPEKEHIPTREEFFKGED